jgi:hypothetical protein
LAMLAIFHKINNLTSLFLTIFEFGLAIFEGGQNTIHKSLFSEKVAKVAKVLGVGIFTPTAPKTSH